jgi:hypothetical protein
LTDLNDFLTPSQACIKPVEEVKPDDLAKQPGAAAVRGRSFLLWRFVLTGLQTQIQIDASGTYYEVSAETHQGATSSGSRKKLEQAQISLNDCLACRSVLCQAREPNVLTISQRVHHLG